jgi:uncharacterized SAM-binding protein YcdF (DUF218 family)
MAFITSKIVLSLILPPASPLIIMAMGFLIIRCCRSLGRFLVASGFLLLYVLSISPASNALLKPLETIAEPWRESRAGDDAIVVLGGGVGDLSWLELPAEPSCSSNERIIEGIKIYRKIHLPLVFVGGNGDPSRSVTPDADVMARTARALGVPVKDIIVENKSRNTFEGARALKNVIKGTGIILVTSASHMKRASALFTKQGFRVKPAPTGYRCQPKKPAFQDFIPRAGNLEDSSIAISEYVGLLWYSQNGEI